MAIVTITDLTSDPLFEGLFTDCDDCCGTTTATPETPAASSSSAAPAAPIDCPSDCSSCTGYDIVISGLTTAAPCTDCFTVNNTYTGVSHDGDCTWSLAVGGGRPAVDIACSSQVWTITIGPLPSCFESMTWTADNLDDCPPTTGWTVATCPSGCGCGSAIISVVEA